MIDVIIGMLMMLVIFIAIAAGYCFGRAHELERQLKEKFNDEDES